jgi:D-3-phosphoglycerate dehydrogenase
VIGAAGLDVFETEPLEPDHPLRACPNALLTPHFAWYSRESIDKLHIMGLETAVRALRGETLNCIVNGVTV